MTHSAFAPRSLLYVPGSNARALEKAGGLAADMLIIDLEDAVPADRKAEARAAMRAAVTAGFAGKRVAVRVNASGSAEQADDLAALDGLALDAVVLPKVDAPSDLDPLRALGLPLMAMIETPTAIYAAQGIAADAAVQGLIAGLNDLAYELKLPYGMDRGAMSHAIQAIVLAARAGGVWCFDGKTLIHPSQVDPCNRAFAPSPREIAAAEALVAAATGGAQRHAGHMIEDMHVAAARALLERARAQ